MLDTIRLLISNNPDKRAFFKIIGMYFPKYSSEYTLIENAYNIAKKEFEKKYRQSGERYFEHLRAVALILILYLRVRDANMIAAAFLHDITEDIKSWDQIRVATMFNSTVSQLVWWVSKEDVLNFGGNKEKRNVEFYKKLIHAPREPALIKLSDKLHNLITLWSKSKADRKRTVDDVKNFFIPFIAEKHGILIHELEAAISEIENA